MTNLTITVNGKKSGEQIYFKLNMTKASFFEVVEMEFNSVEDVLKGEREGIYTISK